MSSQVELCEHHAKDCLQAAEKTEDPWRARCLSGMRWSGCATGLQHPSNRSSAPFVDARQHRDRAWYTEPSTGLRCDGALCLMGSTAWTRPRRLALEPRCIGVAPSRPKLRTNFVTRGPNTSLTGCRWQTFTPPLSALPMSSGRVKQCSRRPRRRR